MAKNKTAVFMETDIENITKTLESLDTDVFNSCVSMIGKARRIYIIGIRSCEPLASLLGFYLNLIRDQVVVVKTSSTSELLEQMMHINEKDLCIGISFPRYSKRVLRAMEFANSRNAGVIAITDSINSPICLYSSCNLTAVSTGSRFFESLTAPLSLVNALISAVYSRYENKVNKNLMELEDIWQSYQVYSIDELEYAHTKEDE